jgi:hypothetical protein
MAGHFDPGEPVSAESFQSIAEVRKGVNKNRSVHNGYADIDEY